MTARFFLFSDASSSLQLSLLYIIHRTVDDNSYCQFYQWHTIVSLDTARHRYCYVFLLTPFVDTVYSHGTNTS